MALNCGFLDHMTPPNNRAFSLDLYEQLDDPRNGDVQFLVPGRLLSFKQPSAAPGADAEAGLRGWWDDDNGIRQFSAPFFARKLEALGATTLLRLADAGYDRAPFEEHGVAVRDLDFHGMSTPPAYTAVQFLLACDEAPGGAVALQCRSGLGRSATLAGLWLMREHRFSAREAIAWLRVMKPGEATATETPPPFTVLLFARGLGGESGSEEGPALRSMHPSPSTRQSGQFFCLPLGR
mmetsp:Transcript_60692/g.162105  ORF Transcript_60692/g.162105 Transcript_60692/m.162105 type:complete len:237 (-) Transcript_60692:601-1311(-)